MSLSNPEDRIATIITDASHNNLVRMGSWAGRVIQDNKRMTYGGVLKGSVDSSQDAEMAAVVNTIHKGLCEEIITTDAGWFIQSDNSHVVNVLMHHFGNQNYRSWPQFCNKTTPYQTRLVTKMRELVETVKPPFVHIKHVKGHVKYHFRDRKHHVHADLDNLARNCLRDHLRTLAGDDVLHHSCPTCHVLSGNCINSSGEMRTTHYSRICQRVRSG